MRAKRVGQCADLGEPGDRVGLRPVLAQHPHQPPHRAQRLAAGDLDPFEGGAGLPAFEGGEAGGAGLDDDAGDMVGDQVVQLPRQFQALGGPYGREIAQPLGVLPAQDQSSTRRRPR